MLRVSCQTCGRKLKASLEHAGKRVRCPGCQSVLQLPVAEEPSQHDEPKTRSSESVSSSVVATSSNTAEKPDRPEDPFDWFSALTDNSPPSASRSDRQEDGPENASSPHETESGDDGFYKLQSVPPAVHVVPKPSPAADEADLEEALRPDSKRFTSARRPEPATGWRNRLHWAFLLCMVPLALSVLIHETPTEERLIETIGENPDAFASFDGDTEDLLMALPDHRIHGAHLGRQSKLHWLYAALSAGAFLAMMVTMFPDSGASSGRLIVTGAITGTVGIMMLLAFQWIAAVTQGVGLLGGNVLFLLLFIVKFIGFSYRCAVEEGNGFLLSFMGFTCGVGFCEELCKAIPVAWFLRSTGANWRASCLVGLASGVGFGVSEGISYSGDMYNGLATGSIYLVRFVSCVGLHAVWAGAVALTMYANQDYISELDWQNAIYFVLYYLAVPMILHGLYDTLLKQNHELGALAVAAGSVAWLIWLIERHRSAELA